MVPTHIGVYYENQGKGAHHFVFVAGPRKWIKRNRWHPEKNPRERVSMIKIPRPFLEEIKAFGRK